MQIETVPIDKLNPAEYNPRRDLKPGDPDYDKLKKSILAFDMVEPLVWNKKSGNLVGGHQRLKVLKELGYTETEVSVVNLSPSKEKALNLALNKIQGEWDYPTLKDLLQDLDTGEFDLEITGFDLGEIENLMAPVLTPDGEWSGMPEFNQENLMGYCVAHVHFKTLEDLNEFAELIGQKLTQDKTMKRIWYPEQKWEYLEGKRYKSES